MYSYPSQTFPIPIIFNNDYITYLGPVVRQSVGYVGPPIYNFIIICYFIIESH